MLLLSWLRIVVVNVVMYVLVAASSSVVLPLFCLYRIARDGIRLSNRRSFKSGDSVVVLEAHTPVGQVITDALYECDTKLTVIACGQTAILDRRFEGKEARVRTLAFSYDTMRPDTAKLKRILESLQGSCTAVFILVPETMSTCSMLAPHIKPPFELLLQAVGGTECRMLTVVTLSEDAKSQKLSCAWSRFLTQSLRTQVPAASVFTFTPPEGPDDGRVMVQWRSSLREAVSNCVLMRSLRIDELWAVPKSMLAACRDAIRVMRDF